MLKESGVDTSIFSAHSTRHASTSKVNNKGVSVDVIKKTAGWSEKSRVFAEFYNQTIVSNDEHVFAKAIIQDYNTK